MNLSEDYKKLDPSGVERALQMFPEQIRNAFGQTVNCKLLIDKFDTILVSGMGGSSNAGKIIQSILEPTYDKPFIVYNDYDLPAWVNKNTLVIVNSYSGNTEESLTGYQKAKELGCQVIGISTGGKINDVIIDPKDTNPTGFPKTGLGVSLGGLLGVLYAIGVMPNADSEIDSTLQELEVIRKTWNVKETAEWLHGYIPVLFAGRPLLGALNAGRNATCEIGRTYTQFYDFPEVNHVLIEALQQPDSAKQNKYLFFESNLDNERIKLRYKITKELFGEMGLHSTSYILRSTSFLGQLLELTHYCAWIGFYLSILRNDDPGPEPWIIKLKESLSQPVH